MRFSFIQQQSGAVSIDWMCKVMNVTARGYRAWRSRPMSYHQRKDMVVLAHIKEQFKLSLGSYGRPRMTEELKELGLRVGHRRVGRLMRDNGIFVKRNKKFKATTDSDHNFNIAPNLLGRNFYAPRPWSQHRLIVNQFLLNAKFCILTSIAQCLEILKVPMPSCRHLIANFFCDI